jgi:hypothetical protein
LWGLYHGVLLIAYRAGDRMKWFHEWVYGGGAIARVTSWLAMFHLTCFGWLIFRARTATQLGTMTAELLRGFAPRTVNVEALLVPLVMYTTPLLVVHVCEAFYDNVLVVPSLPVGVRYSVYAATFYLTMLFGNFGGAEFIYFQF